MTLDSRLVAELGRIPGTRVLCVGDAMLDRFVYGTVERISPEAPVPVLHVEREAAMLGGAGNVVRNLVAVGAEVCFVSVAGRDDAGREITQLLGREDKVESHLLVQPDRQTTIKVRYVAGAQQLLRADQETVQPISEDIANDLARRAELDIETCNSVVLSDYGKGVLTDAVVARLIHAARAAGKPVVVDPKGRNFRRYAGATVLTPNRRELQEATGLPVDGTEAIVAGARSLIKACDLAAVLVTRSQEGMTLVMRDGAVHNLAASAREVFDVSGAGDTVMGVLAAALGAGSTLPDAAHLANVAAGIVVGKVGTAVAYGSEIVSALHAHDLLSSGAKLATLKETLDRVGVWRRRGLRIGFTNGCFDLLHPGHVSLLAQARAACDRLIVGLNSDASVARLKGPGRPVQSEAARAAVLGSLASVDLVVIFEDDTPIYLIEAIRPDVLVKGADYTIDKVVGAELIRSWGGMVVLADLVAGESTSRLVTRIAG